MELAEANWHALFVDLSLSKTRLFFCFFHYLCCLRRRNRCADLMGCGEIGVGQSRNPAEAK